MSNLCGLTEQFLYMSATLNFSEMESGTNFPEINDLEKLEQECWSLLKKGSEKGKDGFHSFVLATNSEEGPDARCVVLRGVDKNQLHLFCHTDIRSPKTSQLSRFPGCSLLFYDNLRRMQIRIQAHAELIGEGDLWNKFWEEARLSTRKGYLCAFPPGEILDAPGDSIPPHLLGLNPTLSESEAGKPNFLLIRFKVKRLDWLQLSSRGHRRARFVYENDHLLEANWIQP